jgi:hypothetical protein
MSAMSYSFVQASYNKEETDVESKYETYTFHVKKDVINSSGMILAIPKPEKGACYNKIIVECCTNILQQCANSLSKSVTNIGGRKTEHGIDIEMRHQIAEASNVLQWIVNSTSWETGEYEDFDKFEIQQKLDMIKLYSI